jgi:hypothetical protein
MKRVLILVLAALCASCATPEPASSDELEDLDPGTLRIDIGRTGLISAKTLEIAQGAESKRSESLESPAVMNSMLRAEVWQYNATRASVCLYGYLPEHSCGPPYLPKWIHESEKTAPSLAVLRARANELSMRVVALWDAACEEAKSRMKHEDWFPQCSVE